MRRLLPAAVAAAIVVALALVAVGGSALAYFSTTGAGSVPVLVGSISKPAITAATPAAGGTVTLTWSAVAAPGAGTMTYYVSRDGGEPEGSCPDSSAPAAGTSCVDANVGIGTHAYTVTAVFNSWTATSSTSSAKITIGPVTHFTITAATTTPAAGAADNLTITARDAAESTVTTYAGSHSLTFSGASSSPGGTAPTVANASGTAVAFGAATALTFTSGVATVTSSKNGVLKVYRAGAASIAASEGSIATTSPLALTVAPGVATKYALAAATTTPVAGTVDNLTITALDTYGNTATSYTGSHSLVFSGASASPGGNVPTVVDFDGDETAFGTATSIVFSAGVATASGGDNGAMELFKSGSASIKATEGSITNSTALALTVAAATATKLVLTSSSLTPVAAASFNLTTTAVDAFGNTATSYAGSKSVVFSGPEASPAGTAPTVVNAAGTAVPFGSATALTFTAGVAAVGSSKNGLTRLYRAGATSISASDGTISTPAPLALTVAVGAAARFALVNALTSAGVLGSPCLFTCAVTLLGNSGTLTATVAVTDSAGNTVSALGTGHSAKVTATGGTIVGTPLTIAATGPAVSTATFVYTAPLSGAYSNTVTIAAASGTAYTSATASTSR